MRLDHLLSKEQVEAETRKLILWSIRLRDQSSISCQRQQKHGSESTCESNTGAWVDKQTHSVFTEHIVWKLRRSLCIVFRVHVSTLTTAQQERFDKRPVAKSKGHGSNPWPYENCKLVSGRSDEKIKLIRAQGGCPGTIRRRRS